MIDTLETVSFGRTFVEIVLNYINKQQKQTTSAYISPLVAKVGNSDH